ncbi:hypothetical protein GTV32_09800 [Gordonia sp. SID5947]|uniref:hypothetical protein n=1 Tax=Gordonia sp. SID5947 TaxID=2690315 RepID=UPI00136D5695|nr:hypothetical protein [Gordonia sp. SID5947]MYR06585.1 hypothetical protein [Gordonia sp. SID5947]
MVDSTEGFDLAGARSAIESAAQNLEFDDDAAAPAVQACTDLINVLFGLQSSLIGLQNVSGMEAFGSSRMLATGLGARGDDSTGHFGHAVTEHLETARALRDAIEQAAKRYVETEGGNADSLKFPHDASDNGKLPNLLDPSMTESSQQPAPPMMPIQPIYVPGLGTFRGSS